MSSDCVLVLVSPPGEGLVNIGATTRREGRVVVAVNNNNNINQLYLVIISNFATNFHLVCCLVLLLPELSLIIVE